MILLGLPAGCAAYQWPEQRDGVRRQQKLQSGTEEAIAAALLSLLCCGGPIKGPKNHGGSSH